MLSVLRRIFNLAVYMLIHLPRVMNLINNGGEDLNQTITGRKKMGNAHNFGDTDSEADLSLQHRKSVHAYSNRTNTLSHRMTRMRSWFSTNDAESDDMKRANT